MKNCYTCLFIWVKISNHQCAVQLVFRQHLQAECEQNEVELSKERIRVSWSLFQLIRSLKICALIGPDTEVLIFSASF